LGVRLRRGPVVRARPADRALRSRPASVPDGAAPPARAVAALPGAARDLPAAGPAVRRRARDPGRDARAALGAAPPLPQFDCIRGPGVGLRGRDVFRDPPDVGGDRCGVFAPVAGLRAGVSRVRLEGDRMASQLPETQHLPRRRRLPAAQLTFEAYWLVSRHPLAYAGQIIVLSAFAIVTQAVVTVLVDGFTADVGPPPRPLSAVGAHARPRRADPAARRHGAIRQLPTRHRPRPATRAQGRAPPAAERLPGAARPLRLLADRAPGPDAGGADEQSGPEPAARLVPAV